MSQKQPAYDEAEQQRLHDDSIRSYWTPERIRNCKVEDDDTDEEAIPGKKQQVSAREEVAPTVVPDETRKTLPYQNVGRITYVKNFKNFIATAYVADTGKGKNIVFTAAHNLINQKGQAEKIMFTPALQSDGKPVNEFGQFPQLAPNSWVVSSNWVPTDPKPRQYDIGAIKLSTNVKKQQVGEVLPGFEIETEPNAQQSGYVKDETEWKIIGYPDNNMYESDGRFIELEQRTTQSKTGYVVKRTNSVLEGMSGSPWLLKNALGKFEKANGDHSVSAVGSYAVTPFYSTAKVDDILRQL